MENSAINAPQKFLNKLNKPEFIGIGSVYLITLLYFLSHGKYPIYDKYAMMALTAILEETPPKDKGQVLIDYKALPDSRYQLEKFKKIMSCEMEDYMGKLDTVFHDEWRTNRDIDRALWVYGHLFTDDKKKACK